MKQVERVNRVVTGKVVGSKANKTISVEIERIVPHPVYGKFIRRTGTILAHDEDNSCKQGDVVAVSECRPISKRKVWKLERIIERNK